MLILTRKTGETIRIAPDIELIVVGVRQGEVILGLKAPRDVKILRGELAMEDNPPCTTSKNAVS